jgi:GNAT superfamily N-acetyltransferase
VGVTEWPVIGPVASFLRRAFIKEPPFAWSPARIGPRFEWLDYTHIRMLDGRLAGRDLELTTEVLEAKANVYISVDGKQVARTYIERDPPGKGIVLWDIAVKEQYRRQGIASVMTYVGFRELLSIQETAFFKIRMIRLMKPGDKNIELQNVGIGVIGNRLGFTPEFNVDKILRPDNVISLEILPAKGDFPPSFKIVIRTFPLVLIAFVLDADSLKPVDDFRTYVKLSKDESVIFDWVRRGLIVIGNGNYWLRRDGLDQFVNHLATDEFEAKVFRRRIRGA